MNTAGPQAPTMQPEDYRALLRGVCIFNWCAAALALVLELLIRGDSALPWPHWGHFSWTYNIVLAEFCAVTLGLTLLLRDSAWLDRAPREALGRLRWLLLAALLLDALHVLGFFQLTGALNGPMVVFLPLIVLTLYLSLPRRDAHLVNALFLAALLLMLLGQAVGLLPARGMLAAAFDQGASLPSGLIALAALAAAMAVGTLVSARMARAGIGLYRGVSYDPLTRLFTREVLERRVPGELARIGRSESSAALLMIEFKNLHELIPQADYAGFSTVLVRFAAALRGATRESGDTCAQFDLNTFAVLLPTASAASAQSIARRIQQSADEIRAPQDAAVSVQLAIGVATTRQAQQTDADRFITAAREALGEAWQAGPGHQLVLREV